MRVTSNTIQSQALANLQAHLRRLDRVQARVSTGLRIRTPSDDPSAAGEIMRSASALRALEQYRRNVGAAAARAGAEEEALSQLTDVLARARELAVSQGTDTTDDATRASTRAEVQQLLAHAVGISNARYGGLYIFGGDRGGSPPVEWDDASAPPAIADGVEGELKAEIASGQMVTVNRNADTSLGGSGPGSVPQVLGAIWELVEALAPGGGSEEVRGTLGGLERAFDHVQNMLGDVGARATQLRVAAANLDALELNLRTFKSDLEEADLTAAMTELIGRQQAFEAAMLATSRIMGLTLADYLR